MAVFDKKEAFMKQISIFLNSKEYQKAYELAEKFEKMHPAEMVSYFFMAKCAFYLGSYEKMMSSARKAYNKASGNDLEACAILLASAYYKLGKFKAGYGLLEKIKKTKNPDVVKLRFMLAITGQNEKAARKHLTELSKISKKDSEAFMLGILRGNVPISETISKLKLTPVKTKRSKK